MKKLLLLKILILIFSCSKDNNSITIPKSNENYILNFNIKYSGKEFNASIDEEKNEIILNQLDIDVTGITPFITISSNATISPKSGVLQNFTSPINYQVTAEDGSSKNYLVKINNISLENEHKVHSFKLVIDGEEKEGVIDEVKKTINFEVAGANLDNLTPTIQFSNKASISPLPNIAQNFNNEVAYTVIAEDGTLSIYRVIIKNRALKSDKSILGFSVTDGTISSSAKVDNDNKIISFNYGTRDRSHLTPSILVSEYATITPSTDTPQDFSNPVIYTVTAEDGTQTTYEVIANVPSFGGVGGSNFPTYYYTGAELTFSGDFIDTSISGSKLVLSNGEADYPLKIISFKKYDGGENDLIVSYYYKAIIPSSTPTNTNYKIVYDLNGSRSITSKNVDVIQENSPDPLSLNKELYQYKDELIITGTNLTQYLAIPAPNGSIYIFSTRDITLNNSKTEMRITLDNYQLFPGYYGMPPNTTKIIILGPNRRRGRSIIANFD
jgi:hypothetical protein